MNREQLQAMDGWLVRISPMVQRQERDGRWLEPYDDLW